jgi:hypothetical protein
MTWKRKKEEENLLSLFLLSLVATEEALTLRPSVF